MSWLRDNFYTNKTQRTGLLILGVLLFVLIIVNLTIDHFYVPAPKYSNALDTVQFITIPPPKNITSKDIDQPAAEKVRNNSLTSRKQRSNVKNRKNESFDFDPNSLSKDSLVRLGFKPYIADRIIKYRSTGAKFYKPSDLAKVYGINKGLVDKLSSKMLFHKAEKMKFVPQQKSSRRTYKQPPKVNERFQFDPNTVSKEALIRLGFKPYISDRIIKYRNSGARFMSASDMKKIYGIDTILLNQLNQYILIPNEYDNVLVPNQVQSKTVEKNLNSQKKEIFSGVVNLNNATSDELVKVPGIGEYYASKIIALREKVGGFYSVDQLLDIYSLPKQKLEKMKTFLKTDDSFKRININTSDARTLVKHRYIDWKQATSIVDYRKLNGLYKNVDDLKNVHIIDADWLDKVEPYFSY